MQRHKKIFDGIKSNIKSSKLIQRLLGMGSQSTATNILDVEQTMSATNNALKGSQANSLRDMLSPQRATQASVTPLTPSAMNKERNALSGAFSQASQIT